MTDISALEAYAGQLSEAAALAMAAAQIQSEIVNGDAATDVLTESGPVPSLAKQAVLAETKVTAALEEVASGLSGAMSFTTTAKGLLATQPGELFGVLSPSNKEYVVIYENVAGVAVDTGKAYPSAKAITSVFDPDSYSHSGYALAVVDASGRMGLGLREDGALTIAGVEDVGATLTSLTDVIDTSAERPRSGIAFAVVGEDGRAPLIVTEEGELLVGGVNVKEFAGADLSGRLDTTDAQVAGLDLWINGLKSIACWGDSLTAGGYPAALATAIGRTVRNGGVGGNYSYQVAARQGGRPTYMTFVGGSIPASGSVVVATLTVIPMTMYGTQTLLGTVGGVPGTLARQADDSYTFTRTAPGTDVTVPVALPFIPAIGQSDFEIAVIWAGRNNYTNPTQVLSDVRAMVNFLKPLNKRFVVMSPPNGNYEDEYIGGSKYHYFTEIRDGLRNEYPNNFLDIWQLLVESYDPTKPQDVIDHGRGITPTSKRYDALHPNGAGDILVANFVKDFLLSKGY